MEIYLHAIIKKSFLFDLLRIVSHIPLKKILCTIKMLNTGGSKHTIKWTKRSQTCVYSVHHFAESHLIAEPPGSSMQIHATSLTLIVGTVYISDWLLFTLAYSAELYKKTFLWAVRSYLPNRFILMRIQIRQIRLSNICQFADDNPEKPADIGCVSLPSLTCLNDQTFSWSLA